MISVKSVDDGSVRQGSDACEMMTFVSGRGLEGGIGKGRMMGEIVDQKTSGNGHMCR